MYSIFTSTFRLSKPFGSQKKTLVDFILHVIYYQERPNEQQARYVISRF